MANNNRNQGNYNPSPNLNPNSNYNSPSNPPSDYPLQSPPNISSELQRRAVSLLQDFLREHGHKSRTQEAYLRDFLDFQKFLHALSVEESIAVLLRSDHGAANQLAASYKNSMDTRNLSSATINRRLSALRSIVKMARRFGIINWALDVPNMKNEPYRDTAGPGYQNVFKIIDFLEQHKDPKSLRDLAMIRLMYDLALRREEVLATDVEDLDFNNSRGRFPCKGKDGKQWLTMASQTMDAIKNWLEARGRQPGALFISFDSSKKGNRAGRLEGSSLYRIVQKYGQRLGIDNLHPHSFRHTAITQALEVMGGNVRKVQRFSRHQDVRVLIHYDDAREDATGEITNKIAERPKKEEKKAEEKDGNEKD